MALTYNEFNKIVPKETVDFFNFLLPYLDHHIGRGAAIYFNGGYNASDNGSKSYYLSVYALNSLKEYMAFLGESGFNIGAYNLDKQNTTNEKT